MRIKKYEDEIAWKEARKTKITGSRLKDIVVLRGTGKKIGFYELIAERLAVPRPEGEDKMARGHELEPVAIALCENELGKTFNKDLVIWERDEEACIAISPDAFLDDLTEAVEVKCLGSAKQIKAIIENQPEDEYKWQYLQYFIVNDKLEKLHVIMYDPSFVESLQYKRFEITREELKEDIATYLEYQRKELEEIGEIVNKLSF